MGLQLKHTLRGFSYYNFKDRYDTPCIIQKSSLATEDAIWIGVDKAAHKVLAKQAANYGIKTEETTGWVEYPIPEGVLVQDRMHLTQSDVRNLLPILQYFADNGELPPMEE